VVKGRKVNKLLRKWGGFLSSDMKTYSLIILFTLILCGISKGQANDSLKFKSLPPAEFLAAYQKAQKGLMIDVREFFEYRKSRIKDAINIPSSGNLEVSADTLDKDSNLFLYCTSGFRSKRVAKFLSEEGFTKVYSLDGGLMAWRKEGMPVVKKKLRR
jgi:rhodanese-related sulfurtransferase